MCDTPNNNASSSSSEERQQIINRIDTRIASLITPIDENDHIDSTFPQLNNYTFEQTLKRKIEETPTEGDSNDRSTKTVRLTTTKYHPINIATINVRGFNDPVKQFQITNYIELMHLDIIGLSELHVTNPNFGKNLCFTTNKN